MYFVGKKTGEALICGHHS